MIIQKKGTQYLIQFGLPTVDKDGKQDAIYLNAVVTIVDGVLKGWTTDLTDWEENEKRSVNVDAVEL